MAKVSRLYVGCSSIGSDVEVAESVNGGWFMREKVKSPWGYKWSKWSNFKEPVMPSKIRCRVECANAPEFVDVKVGKYIEFGFTELRLFEGGEKLGYRLPNS